MSKLLIVLIVVCVIAGTFAAPGKDHKDKKGDKKGDKKHGDHKHGKHGHHGHMMSLNMKTCLKQETLDTFKQTFHSCKPQPMSTPSTTPSTTTDEEKHKKMHKFWVDAMTCVKGKFSNMLVASGAKSIVDAATLFAKNNMTENAQASFLNATNNCLNKKEVKLETLTKADSTFEDWEPAKICVKKGLMASCEKFTRPTGTPSVGGSTTQNPNEAVLDVESDDENN